MFEKSSNEKDAEFDALMAESQRLVAELKENTARLRKTLGDEKLPGAEAIAEAEAVEEKAKGRAAGAGN